MRRLFRWLLATTIVVGVLFVVANIVVQRVAESKIASTLQTTFHLSVRPAVKISGFPIISNILSGHLPHVSFSADSASFQGLSVQDISVSLEDVSAEGGFLHSGPLSIKVGAGTIRARATDAAVSAYLEGHGKKATIAFHAGGATVRALRTFLGRARRLVATGTVARDGATLMFRPTSVTVDGASPPPGMDALAEQRATIQVQLPKLPGGITSYGVEAIEGGVVVSAVLRDQVLDLSG